MRRLERTGAFWAACSVLALCLWASGAPSVLYPVYAVEWHLAPVVTTSVFGTYPLALLVTLLLFGSISDAVGRRRAMIAGIALIAISAATFAVAPGVGFLYLGRVLQGVGTALALGAASAALVENNPFVNPRVASSLATVSTSTGLTLALLLTGLLAQFAPLPMSLSYIVLFVLGLLAITLLALTRDDRPVPRTRWRPQAPRIAPGMARVFVIATISVSTAYAVGAIFLSLGATMARELSGTTALAVIGTLLAVSSISIGVTALLIGKVPAHVLVIAGAAVSLGGLAVMVFAAASGSIALFFAWCVVGGVGYSLSFTGGLALINRTAPAHHRGATLSFLYLFAYLLQAITAVGAGALATSIGLGRAIDIAAPSVAVLCIAGATLAIVDGARRRRLDVVALSS